MSPDVEVRDNPDQARYEVVVDGRVGGFAQYELEEGRIKFLHTEIDPAHEGGGLGSRLARAALDDARARELPVVPLCPFIAGYIRRHPDPYASIVVADMRERVTGGS